jgi:hypothetical protein
MEQKGAMRCCCPKCSAAIAQDRNPDGLNYCPQCRNLFLLPPLPKMPPWILGVLEILTVNWQIMVLGIGCRF